jgi:hypothetical protein
MPVAHAIKAIAGIILNAFRTAIVQLLLRKMVP